MKKFIKCLFVFLCFASGVAAQNNIPGIIIRDTLQKPIGGGAFRIAYVDGKLKIVRSIGNTIDVITANNTYANPAWISSIDLTKVTGLQSGLDAKAPLASPTFTGTVTGITKSMVGLANVDNTSDLSKPISTATQSALNAKAPLASPTFTGTVTGITKSMVGLANVDNTSDLSKPISTATQAALDTKQPTLVSGTNIKTINGVSVLGSGDMTISSGGGTWGSITGTLSAQTDLQTSLNGKMNLTGTSALAGDIVPSTSGLYSLGSNSFRFQTAFVNSLNFASTSPGYTHYNTADQVTNTESLTIGWSGNIAQILTKATGTGTSFRNLEVGIFNAAKTVWRQNPTITEAYVNTARQVNSSNLSLFSVVPTPGHSGGTNYGLTVYPTINTTGTGGHTAVWIPLYKTGTGTGTDYIIDGGTINQPIGTSGTYTSKFSVDNTGLTTLQGVQSLADGTGALGQQTRSFANTYSIAINTEFVRERYSNSNLEFRQFNNTVAGRMVGATGNWILQTGGTFTDNGAKLQVTGPIAATGYIASNGYNLGGSGTLGSIYVNYVSIPIVIDQGIPMQFAQLWIT